MRDLPIAYGNSCYAKTWANKTTAWEDLCERLKNTIRTTETVEEYPKLKKDDRDRAKDKGGFVGGYLKGNRRKRETVVCRSMLTMDADHAEIGFIDRFASECRYSSCLYTTHGHTPEQPRCRIIVPLTRDITPDEYVALARYFASDWGIDQFDECSYKPSQLMYWPTTPANGEFISKTAEGEWLDPDVYLTAHPNWKDCSLLPTSSRESAVREASGKKQEDPLAKPGVVGAFCRAYGIAAVIETYLADVYEPSAMAGRYDYIPADSSAGVVVYDDKFAYSHHATDPACGKLLNAFDLVRIHRFGDDDEKKSFKLFCGICGKPYCYYHYTTTNKQLLAAYRCMSRKTQSAAEVPGQTYTPPHKATFNRNASAKLIAYRERYCKPPKERPMLCTDVRIPTDLPQKAFCRAWNLIVAKKLRYQATLRITVDNAEDILVRYRAAEMCLLIDEIGKITEFSYPLMLKTLDRVVVNTNGKLSFIFQSGIKITV